MIIRGINLPLIIYVYNLKKNKFIKIVTFTILILSYMSSLNSMEKKPYHHIYKDGKLFAFRNLEGGPKRDPNFK